MAIVAVISFFSSKTYNPITEEEQYVNITQEQEIALGLQAAPSLTQEFGGLDPDPAVQSLVDQVGQRLIQESFVNASDYPFEFHVLADRETVNAFALPGGQVFITRALLDQIETEGQLAAVLAHEMIHVVGRHGAERIAEMQLSQGLTGALLIATYDPDNPDSQRAAQMAALLAQLVHMKFGREDELESDYLGVRTLAEAGYDPRAMIGLMQILASSNPGQTPEFFSTHPNPENRIARIEAAIEEAFPQGIPALEP